MPVTVDEKFGRLLSDRSAELTYIVRGTDDDGVARTNLAATAPAWHNNLKRDDVEVEQVSNDLWLGTVRYVEPDPAEEDPEEILVTISFDTTGGTQHITHSLNTTSFAAPGETAPDFKGGIGVTRDSVEGVDITVPAFNFQVNKKYPEGQNPDLSTLYQKTGKTNNGPVTFTDSVTGLVLNFAAGELLFLGASGGRGEDARWDVTFALAASPNATNLTLGPITGINKKGWEYLWVRYEDAEDTTAKALVKRPVAVYVEKVYEETSFAGIG